MSLRSAWDTRHSFVSDGNAVHLKRDYLQVLLHFHHFTKVMHIDFNDVNGSLRIDPDSRNHFSLSVYHAKADGDFSRTLTVPAPATTFAIPTDQPTVSIVSVDQKKLLGEGSRRTLRLAPIQNE